MKKPRFFVGSSTESLSIAYAVQQELDYDAEVTVWTQGVFEPSGTTMLSLLAAAENTDFALFVFAPDDILRIRDKDVNSVRDNVVFELGLFIGKLGLKGVFFLRARDSEMHLPSDLLGITPLTFVASRSDGNLRAAVGPACNEVRRVLANYAPAIPQKLDQAELALSDNEVKEALVAWLGRTVLDKLTRPMQAGAIEKELGLPNGSCSRTIAAAVEASGRPLKISINAGGRIQMTEVQD